MDLNKYLNNAAPSEPQYSKEEYAAMKKTEREAVWVQVDARMGEVLADASTLQGFLDFMSQCRNSLPNQLLLSGQNADITDARTFQQWKDDGRHIRTGEEGYTAIVGQVYENNGRKASGYNIGKVFDITQTRGRPVPPPAEYQVDELIAASIENSSVPIQISDSLPDGIQAQYVPKNRTIYVRNGIDAGTNLLTPGSKKHFRMILKAVKRNEISKAAHGERTTARVDAAQRCDLSGDGYSCL